MTQQFLGRRRTQNYSDLRDGGVKMSGKIEDIIDGQMEYLEYD